MLDPEKLKSKRALIGQMTAWANTGALIGLGVRLGLYSVLASLARPATGAEIAAASGLNDRLVLEWLRGQAAAGVLEYDGDGRFHITEEMASLLGDEDSLQFAGYPFVALPARIRAIDHLMESFRTGQGFGWDEIGPDLVASTERARRVWFEHELIPRGVGLIEGMLRRLESGAEVVDVGCGSGLAIIQLAKQFPASIFHGYEVSALSLERAAENLRKAGLPNVFFHDATKNAMRESTFDLAITIDCLHDMAHPEEVAVQISQALKPDGAWFILDFDSEPTYEENLAKNPVFAAGSYATSVLICLPSSLSDDGGSGVGTLGLPEPAMRKLVTGAGFRSCRRLGNSGLWALYEARP